MALYKIADLYPNYKDDIFAGNNIKDFDVYSNVDENKVGSVYDFIIDDKGEFRYLVVDTGLWIFGKKVLLPIGKANIDYNRHRIYALGFTREQVERLPEYNDNMVIDYDYEEKVRSGYRNGKTNNKRDVYNRDTYDYNSEPELYSRNDQNHQNFKLYEERLVVDKDRLRTGGVTVGKHVEQDTANVSIPLQKERVVIERTNPTNAEAVNPGTATFESGEVAHMEVYEEAADIQKQAFVREEVNVKKEVETETVEAQEKIRREQLDVDVQGKPNLKNNR